MLRIFPKGFAGNERPFSPYRLTQKYHQNVKVWISFPRQCCFHVLLHDARRVTVAHLGKKEGMPTFICFMWLSKNKQKQSPFLASVEPTLASRFSPAPDMCHISFTRFWKIKKETVCLLCISLFVLQHSSLADTTHYVRISKSLYIPYRLVGRGSCACFCIVIQLLRDAKKRKKTKPVLLATLCFKEVTLLFTAV